VLGEKSLWSAALCCAAGCTRAIIRWVLDVDVDLLFPALPPQLLWPVPHPHGHRAEDRGPPAV
jgi:hypothetical protein